MIPGHLHSLWAHFSRQTTCTPRVFLPTPVDTHIGWKIHFTDNFVLSCHVNTQQLLHSCKSAILDYQAGSLLLVSILSGLTSVKMQDRSPGCLQTLPMSICQHSSSKVTRKSSLLFSPHTSLVWMMLLLGKNHKHSRQLDLQART